MLTSLTIFLLLFLYNIYFLSLLYNNITQVYTFQYFFYNNKHHHFRDNWLLYSGQRFWEIVAATIEDLAFGIRSSREVHAVDRRVCPSRASYAAAEKSEWRMALKI